MWKRLLCAVTLFALRANPSLGQPTIHVTWDEPSSPPAEFQDYIIDYTNPGYPDIALISGNLTWRIWSESGGSPSDLGSVTCPHAKDFGVYILTPEGNAGAQYIHGDISLIPQGTGSEFNYSRLRGCKISSLLGHLALKQSNGGIGGDVAGLSMSTYPAGSQLVIELLSASEDPDSPSLKIGGNLSGALKIEKMDIGATATIGPILAGSDLSIGPMAAASAVSVKKASPVYGEAVIGHVSIGPMDSATASFGPLASTGQLYVASMDHTSNIFVNDRYVSSNPAGATVHVAAMDHNAQLWMRCSCATQVEEDFPPPCCVNNSPSLAVTVDQVDHSAEVRWDDGPGFLGKLEIGGMSSSARVLCAQGAPQTTFVAGKINLAQGVPATAVVQVNKIGSSGVIDLNDGPVAGALQIDNSSTGQIANGGDVSGAVVLVQAGAFAGSAGFANMSGQVNGGAVSGALTFTGNVSGGVVLGNVTGLVDVQGKLGSGGSISVGNVSGPVTVEGGMVSGTSITASGLSGTGKIDVAGNYFGHINVAGPLTGPNTMVKVRGGLESGSSVDINTSAAASSTAGGTLWIGGSTSVNPLPTLPFEGFVRVRGSRPVSPYVSGELVKLVGCPPYDGKRIDVCLCPSSHAHVTQSLTCFQGSNDAPDTFYVQCPTGGCP